MCASARALARAYAHFVCSERSSLCVMQGGKHSQRALFFSRALACEKQLTVGQHLSSVVAQLPAVRLLFLQKMGHFWALPVQFCASITRSTSWMCPEKNYLHDLPQNTSQRQGCGALIWVSKMGVGRLGRLRNRPLAMRNAPPGGFETAAAFAPLAV